MKSDITARSSPPPDEAPKKSSIRYVLGCLILVGLWLAAWCSSFPNLYGWLTDDIYQFSRISMYERGGRYALDIQWFHAYDWFIATIPWLFHWNVPSHMVPQAWEGSGHFRAFIFYVVFLHAVVLLLVAGLLRQLCRNEAVCIGALLLFMTSPTFMFYADLLDSRYLGLLAGAPAVMILLANQKRIDAPMTWSRLLWSFALPGFLIGLGQSIHYTLLYFAGPVVFCYWCLVVAERPHRRAWSRMSLFLLGFIAWFVPVQLLSLAFQPLDQSMIGTLLFQVKALSSQYDKLADLASWCHFFLEDMGVPMMVAVLAGAAALARSAWRPPYVSAFHASLVLWATVIATAYLVITPSVAFYRQLCMYQIFYVLAALIAVERVSSIVSAGPARIALAGALYVSIAFVPSVLRMPEVFVAAQGLGRALNAAHSLTSEYAVYFIEFYDTDLYPQSIVSRHDFEALSPGDVIVTAFPTIFFAKYPDLFALLHDTRPIASFPTEWCTEENWVEERTYWNFRRYQDEPESCNAQVYRVSDIRREERSVRLRVTALRADSSASKRSTPEELLTRRDPPTPTDLTGCCNSFAFLDRLWESNATSGTHWLEVSFDHAVPLRSITIVPTNYLAPPGYAAVGRPDAIRILSSASARSPMRTIWFGQHLRDSAILDANFPEVLVSELRFEITQPRIYAPDYAIAIQQRLAASSAAGLEYVRLPGYSLVQR